MKQIYVTTASTDVCQPITYSTKSFKLVWALPLLLAVSMLGCKKEVAPAQSDNFRSLTNFGASNSPAPVNLGTAADFTILSQAGISTTGVTAIVGDMGVSPIAATAITGFGLIKDPSNRFSTSPIVTGKIYASNYAAPTPAKMTAAVSDMKTAFTTANGLTTPAPIVNIYAGDVSGRTLPTGLYKWSTNLLITNVGVTLNGGANDVWVFQIAQNLIVNNAAIIHLTGGAQAKNVFWVVSGKATLGTDVDFSGNIMSKTSVSLNTNATVNGRILAQTAVTLIANKVAAVGQLSVSPQSGIVYSAVTISGSNFSTTAANNIVKFNGVNAVVKSATSTELVVTVPFGATSGEVTVTANGTTSTSANNFKVLQMVKYGAVAPGAGFNIQSMDGDANGNTYGTATSIDANGIKSSFVFRYADGVVTRIYNAPAGGGSLGSYTLSNLVVNSQGYLNVAQNHKNGTVTTTKILKIAQSGQVTSGSENPGTVFSMFTNPSGNLYVAMESELKKITPAGTVSVVSGFNPKGATHIVADTFGNIYYSNMVLVNNVPQYTLKKRTPEGIVSAVFTPKAEILSIITDAANNVFLSVGSPVNKVYVINTAGVINGTTFSEETKFFTDNHGGFYTVGSAITRYIFK